MIRRHNKAIHCRLCIRFNDNPIEKSYDLITPTQETLSAHDLLAVDVVKIHLTNTILRHNFDVNLAEKVISNYCSKSERGGQNSLP